jgi:histidinol-phosphatase
VGPDLALALELADTADAISLARFRADDLAVETKPDLTPVTDADRAVEAALRERLTAERPGDAILGEEYGDGGSGERRWIIDPIDGTRNYSRGIPVWGTLIALAVESEPTVGVVSAPALGRRWWAERGGGALASGAPIRVSGVRRIEDAVICLPSEHSLPELAERAWLPRGYGDFWAHMLVAEGVVDGAIDAVGVQPWDLAVAQVIVEEAGGRYSDAAGDRRIDTRTGLTSNGLIHDELVAAASGLPR